MSRMRAAGIVLVALMVFSVTACAPGDAPETEPGVTPRVAPPVIGEAGVLRAGVNADYPPFAGVDRERRAGIDIDVASAIASELGLELELLEVELDAAAAALDAGQIDVMMAVPLTEEAVAGMSFAGFYAATGPALFASEEETVTPDRLGMVSIAVQEGSESYWRLVYDLGEDRLVATPTLREAFELLDAGEVDVVAGDAFVSAYLIRDFEGLRFSSQLAPATQIGVAVAPDATDLSAAVRDALDTLATGGVLDTIRAKWVGTLPDLETANAGSE